MGKGPARAVRAAAAYEAVKRARSLAVAQWLPVAEGESVVIGFARGCRIELEADEADDFEFRGNGTDATELLVVEEATEAAVAAE